MNRALVTVLLLLAAAGCSASGVPTPGQGDAGMVAEVPALRQIFPAGSIAILHAAVLEPATGERTEGQTVLVSGDRITAPAEFLGEVGEIGTVSPGARADLIVVDGDPRDDVAVLRHPRAVMLRGAWLERP
jgi:N-acyl-D-aspartate/D-glutamate deacylase